MFEFEATTIYRRVRLVLERGLSITPFRSFPTLASFYLFTFCHLEHIAPIRYRTSGEPVVKECFSFRQSSMYTRLVYMRRWRNSIGRHTQYHRIYKLVCQFQTEKLMRRRKCASQFRISTARYSTFDIFSNKWHRPQWNLIKMLLLNGKCIIA